MSQFEGRNSLYGAILEAVFDACWRVDGGNQDEPQRLEAALVERIHQNESWREPIWTENIAVGSRDFLEVALLPYILFRESSTLLFYRQALKEEEPSYGLQNTVENRSMNVNSGRILS